MKNKIHLIGTTGNYTAYLNMSREEAIKRYVETHPLEAGRAKIARTVEFDDEFEVYDM